MTMIRFSCLAYKNLYLYFSQLNLKICLLFVCLITIQLTGCSTMMPIQKIKPELMAQQKNEIVVLLHGLARTEKSMSSLQHTLQQHHYQVLNLYYPSRHHSIDVLAQQFVLPQLQKLGDPKDIKVHFVTHSMGGIIVRYLAHHQMFTPSGRVVMLGPPNHGSEIVDKIGHWTLFNKLNGAAGNQLSTYWDSIPNQLGRANFEVGVIAGDRSINWINSRMIYGADDGKVSVESAKLEGMKDFMVVHTTHPMMMKNSKVMKQTLHFLKHGYFYRHQSSQILIR